MRELLSYPGSCVYMLTVVFVACVHAKADTPEAGSENPYVWRSRTTSVSVFKNGYGFFTREGEVALNDGWAHAADVPPATFGTLAIYTQETHQAVDIVGVGEGELTNFDDRESKSDIETKKSKLQTAIATQVMLQYEEGAETKQAIGVVKSISDSYVVLKQGTAAIAIELSSIKALRRESMPLRFHVTSDDGQSPDRTKLSMAYLRSGIVWVPEYTLKLLDAQTAELTLRGTLVNEAEDLIDCDVNFVVGVPHFVHSEMLSPIAVAHAVRALGNALPIPGVAQQTMSQIMGRANIANNFSNNSVNGDISASAQTSAPADFATLMSNLPRVEAIGAGDYSVYTKQRITVRRGERAVVNLMSKRIRYGHKYSWTAGSDIQHQLTLENSSDSPWTTGPCLALSASQPLSEDILKYTPKNGRGELTVTTAVNIAKQITESEANRKLKAHEPNPSQFLDLVTVAGELKLKSYENSSVEIQITKTVQGRPLSASADGSISVDSDKLRLVERSGTISWNLTLEPNQEYRLKYEFERYVPSN